MSALLLALAPAELLPQASTFAPAVDRAFLLALWFAVFLVVLLCGLVALALWAPRSGSGAGGALPRRLLQLSALGALALFTVFCVHGSFVWADMQVVPRGALPVRVAVEERGFSFTYPNGYATGELHLPFDRPVRLMFKGAAAPYTFAVPAFRLQALVGAGESKEAWVQATLAGEYPARSTLRPETFAASLAASVVVHPEGGFDRWYQDISGPPLDLPPIELGQRSYQMRGCTQCHTTDGSKLVGPSFKGFLAREHRMTDGSVVAPTDDYIRESLLDPQAKVVAGFEPVMPSFRGRLHDLEVAGLAAYIKSLQ
jgi:cytochrome c oxidase subunit 2